MRQETGDRPAPRRPSASRGVALVVVLWVLALLGTIAAAFSFATRTETALARNWLEAARGRSAADAGVGLAVHALLRAPGIADPAQRWRPDGTVYETVFGQTRLRIVVSDEAGKVDLNVGRTDLLGGLLSQCGAEPEARQAILDAILDWRDPDSLVHLNGAEDDDYRRAGLGYGAKDAPFESLEELALVFGVDTDLYYCLRDSVTLYAYVSGINPLVATRRVLLALPDVDSAQVDEYIRARELNAAEGLPPPLPTLADRRYFSEVSGPVYSIRVEAQTEGGAVETLLAVVRLGAAARTGNGQPYEVLSWTRALPPQPGQQAGDGASMVAGG
ncbi:general secretion pathway protein GspK [Thioalbus denitrificans]|uniref:General secretion pathway protein K n=1 Tax=Thioalbus denitrificans TaxID=547122 RepID=A0A369C9S7_9GAMM|nr:type II secretion system protein GspK [Thioalbus denitrificans]RCX29928.1 general secretion pathway protein K [Thioalbus denitrificans]